MARPRHPKSGSPPATSPPLTPPPPNDAPSRVGVTEIPRRDIGTICLALGIASLAGMLVLGPIAVSIGIGASMRGVEIPHPRRAKWGIILGAISTVVMGVAILVAAGFWLATNPISHVAKTIGHIFLGMVATAALFAVFGWLLPLILYNITHRT